MSNPSTIKILNSFSEKIASKHESGKDFRVYYKNGGNVVSVITVVNSDENEKLIDDVYNAQAQTLRTFVINKRGDNKLEIDFRLIPRYKVPLKSIVPESFKKYNAA